MSFRPQYAYPLPPGHEEDEQFTYAFDSSIVAALGATIAAGGFQNDIPLLLQPDTEFRWRGFKVASDSGGSTLSIRLKDPWGNYLSDDFSPINEYGVGSGLGNFMGTEPVPLESEIVCPPGGVVWAYLYNPTAAPIESDIVISLFGVKRTQKPRCAA